MEDGDGDRPDPRGAGVFIAETLEEPGEAWVELVRAR